MRIRGLTLTQILLPVFLILALPSVLFILGLVTFGLVVGWTHGW